MKAKKKAEPEKVAAEAPKAAASAETKAARSTKAVLVPEIILQYQGSEVDSASLVQDAKDAYLAQNPGEDITELKLYWKPEDHAAYYVVNGGFDGKIEL